MRNSSKTPMRPTSFKAAPSIRKAASASKAVRAKIGRSAKVAVAGKSFAAPRRTPAGAASPVPAVVGQGRLTLPQVRRAVEVALRGQTFEADAP